MPVFESNERTNEVEGSSDRSFGIVVGAALILIGAWPAVHHQFPRLWAIALGAVFALVGIVQPKLLSFLNRAWTRVGILIGRVMTPIIMGVLLYVVLAPVGAVQRLFGRDQLHLKWDKNAKTYWQFRDPPGPPPATMKNQF